MNWKDIFVRAAKTAIQTFAGVMGAVGLGWLDVELLTGGVVAGLSAGVSVIWNAIQQWASDWGEQE